jgi:hypothetical protein
LFDLTFIPLHLISGSEQQNLPGLLAAVPPRRVERHRAVDQLIVLMTGPGGKVLPESFCKVSLDFLTSTYYHTPGTLTAAIRSTLEQFNEYLLKQIKNFPASNQAPVLLNLAVIRSNILYIAHAGPVHTFIITQDEPQEFYDPTSSGWGLGTSRTLNLRYFQSEVKPGDVLLLAPEAPAAWSPSLLKGGVRLSPEDLYRRLISKSEPDLLSAAIRLQEGNGAVTRGMISPTSAAVPAAAPSASPTFEPSTSTDDQLPAHTAPYPEPTSGQQVQSAAAEKAPMQPVTPTAQKAAEMVTAEIIPDDEVVSAARRRVEERRARQTGAKPKETSPSSGLFQKLFQKRTKKTEPFASQPAAPESRPVAETVPAPHKPARRAWLKGLALLFKGTRKAQQRTEQEISRLVPRVLPGESNKPVVLSPTSMFFVAVAVPVIVVVIATTVYFRSGASEERQAYIQQAKDYAEQAGNQKDANLRRNSWVQSLYWVNKAEEFGPDDQSLALKHRAQVALDSIDGIVRLSLSPAFPNTLGNEVIISRIVATATDLYLLDSSKGRVLHLTLAGRSYEYDPNFTCGPGPSGGKIIGPLVGMVTLPPNNEFKATVMAVDSTGNLLYCIPGEPPVSKSLRQPENNWGKITSISVFNGDLFALDLQGNAVWRFDGVNYNYEDRPRLFFGDIVPNIKDVVDMTFYQDDLYLLHASGKMTTCIYSGYEFAPTRCTDPADYGSRSGPVEFFKQASFIQMQTTEPPDPSLFVLDAKEKAIYHFSLRLNFQRQLRQNTDDDFSLPNRAVTSFAVTANRVLFMAFGNQIYFGALP